MQISKVLRYYGGLVKRKIKRIQAVCIYMMLLLLLLLPQTAMAKNTEKSKTTFPVQVIHKTGDDKEVRDYVMNSKISEEFYAKLTDMIQFLVPQYIEEGKQHLVIGIGCTGGRHRSVTISNLIYDDLVNRGYRVVKKHRDSMLR